MSRSRARAAYFRAYNARKGRRASARERSPRGGRLVLGIDGEGYTTADGRHLYVYLAASDTEGLVSDVRNPKGLTADEVFAWLLTLPRKAMLVGFALGYDRTKWVESWPDDRIYRLMHPESRLGESGPLPVDCEGWRCNLVSTRFSVARADEPDERRTVWDVWKFFQSSFVKAIERWDVGSKEERAFVAKQKERRGNFAAIGKTEERYCQLECRLLAELVDKLLAAHDEAGLRLKSYFGPGSTAAVVLAELEADKHRANVPDAMALAVACAYFGGRFELSRMGPIQRRRLFAYDIVSAYPAAFARLPCLRPNHGRWVHCKGGIGKKHHPLATVVRFRVEPHPRAHPAWGPLPHRLPDGNILFPLESAGGWAWLPEYEAARRLHPGVVALESWSWQPRCRCREPFAARVRELFALRRQWGKSARGLVLKLALNSLYGKSAQAVGRGRYRCMVRAGLVTAMTRARLLEAVARARAPGDVLELATDSVLSLRPLRFRAGELGSELGQWEAKDPDAWEGGVFLMRPGLRFPLRKVSTREGRAEVLAQTAARGVGNKTLAKNRARVLRGWEREPMAPVTLRTPSFFHGATLSVRRLVERQDEDEVIYRYVRDPLYGLWTEESRTLTYTPRPKRDAVAAGPGYRLEPWRLPRGPGCESMPYGVSGASLIGQELARMRELEEDQPDHAGVAMV